MHLARKKISSGCRGTLPDGASLIDRSADFAGLAIQGPRVVEFFHSLFWQNAMPPARNQIQISIMMASADDRAHRLHGRRRLGSFLCSKGRSVRVERSAGKRRTARNQALRSRRTRYAAARNVLPAQRLGSFAGTESNRGRARFFR